MSILTTNRLTKSYGEFKAVTDVNLDVQPNTLHAVIGPNGAGKTTLFHCLTGVQRLTSGRILFDNKEISKLGPEKRSSLGMSRSFQVTSLFLEMTVRENLQIAALGVSSIDGFRFWSSSASTVKKTAAAVDYALETTGFENRAETIAGDLSHGQQRMLEVGMALAQQPKLILLDEPTSGMGVDDIPMISDLVRRLTKDITVLLIEHNMGIVLEISDKITVMQLGQILVEGTPNQIKNDQRVREAYLGGETEDA
ncbi:amino acid/amide ABC transporter ATP-binding protein 1, HAAT family [Ruegeria halocynthiae]|uniref:Amino acid/amide ABC transporter ATP-binding protein 1, HAAT family n=1 Tax=Ruegeria halocynthiae TaxID=985054 RepID=A0A1H3FYM9_9RHOB|nr:ABC transporter ATP-binding protein [Ruegeria halocynthiae]SDX95488.1 amino acid/amide ABC transporter ATP-binding protein 1, HAAT family [Ruegeria halocynthiae]